MVCSASNRLFGARVGLEERREGWRHADGGSYRGEELELELELARFGMEKGINEMAGETSDSPPRRSNFSTHRTSQ